VYFLYNPTNWIVFSSWRKPRNETLLFRQVATQLPTQTVVTSTDAEMATRGEMKRDLVSVETKQRWASDLQTAWRFMEMIWVFP